MPRPSPLLPVLIWLLSSASVLPLTLLSTAAVAQSNASRPSMVPQISGFDVRAVDNLVPGTELHFTAWGTPGAFATLRIEGAQQMLTLVETRPGTYEGTHTLSQRDRIRPDSTVSLSLRRGNQIGTALLDEPLQQGWQATMDPDPAVRIERFAITQASDNRGDDTLELRVLGSAGARVSVQLPGAARRNLRLPEVRPGEYSLNYRVQPDDQLQHDAPANARLRLGDRTVTATLPRALDDRPARRQFVDTRACVTCATVTAINRIEVAGEAGYVGPVAGGLLGAVLGSQIGGGRGRTAAGVAGALGGALLGREVEKRANPRTGYEIVLRMNDGRREVLVQDDPPAWKPGARVRLIDDRLQEGWS